MLMMIIKKTLILAGSKSKEAKKRIIYVWSHFTCLLGTGVVAEGGKRKENRMFVAGWCGDRVCVKIWKKKPKCLTFHNSFTPTPKRISCRGRSVLLLIASGNAKRKIGRESGIGKRSSNSCWVFCVHSRTNSQGKVSIQFSLQLWVK